MKSLLRDNLPLMTVINGKARLTGDVSGVGKIVVQGVVQGDIAIEGEVSIEPNGGVEGNITAENVKLQGLLVGNADVSNRLLLGMSSKMKGDACVGKLLVEEGAGFWGKISMKGAGQ